MRSCRKKSVSGSVARAKSAVRVARRAATDSWPVVDCNRDSSSSISRTVSDGVEEARRAAGAQPTPIFTCAATVRTDRRARSSSASLQQFRSCVLERRDRVWRSRLASTTAANGRWVVAPRDIRPAYAPRPEVQSAP